MGWLNPTKKVSDVSTYVMRQFGDESGVQINDADILRWVNSAQAEIANSNDVLKRTGTLALSADVYSYPLGDSMSIESINSVRVNGVAIEYMNFNEFEIYINNEDPNRIGRGRPLTWTEWGGKMVLYPIPDTAYTMEVFFLGAPEVLGSMTDVLTLPDKYFQRIVDYVIAQAYELDENFAAHASKMENLDNKLVGMSLQENKGAVATYPVMTILPEDL
jgi:hypothetical protein